MKEENKKKGKVKRKNCIVCMREEGRDGESMKEENKKKEG